MTSEIIDFIIYFYSFIVFLNVNFIFETVLKFGDNDKNLDVLYTDVIIHGSTIVA